MSTQTKISISLLMGLFVTSASALELPIRIFLPDAKPVTENVLIDIPMGANAPSSLYLRVHNLRRGGMLSVAVNDSAYHDVFNHTVSFEGMDGTLGGIGGIHGTLGLYVPISEGDIIKPSDLNVGGPNTIKLRFNGSDGNVSGLRVLQINFKDSESNDLVPPSAFTYEDTDSWVGPFTDQPSIDAGKALWEASDSLVDDPLSGRPIHASCASCHFADGSDLHYFNYSNESIITRSQFHGLTENQGQLIASYIRNHSGPNPGTPWDPPFQPVPGMDSRPADEWMAGGGLEAVLDSEEEMLTHLFPEGTTPGAIAEAFDHTEMLNLRELPVPLQLPDWNSWLPRVAPEDLWNPNSPTYGNAPYNTYYSVINSMGQNGENIETLKANGQLWANWNRLYEELLEPGSGWFGFQRAPNEPVLLEARNRGFTDEETKFSFFRWVATKQIELVRRFNLEEEKDNLVVMRQTHPNFYQEKRNFDSADSSIFFLPQHFAADHPFTNFAWEPEGIGRLNSHQWYWLATVTNSNAKQLGVEFFPIDHLYHLAFTSHAYRDSGERFPSAVRLLTAFLKYLQSLDRGVGINRDGFSHVRDVTPYNFYAFHDSTHRYPQHWKVLDGYSPGLWAGIFEAWLYEYMDVVERFDLNDPSQVDRDTGTLASQQFGFEPSNTVATTYADHHEIEVRNRIDQAWWLVSALDRSNPNAEFPIDELLLNDYRVLCQKIWPGPAATPNDWAGRMSIASSWYENFEGNTSVFGDGETVRAIKNAAWVNNGAIGPRNGGGRYVGQFANIGETETKVFSHETANVDLQPGAEKLSLNGRFAVENTQSGVVSVRMSVNFDNGGMIDGPLLVLNNDISGEKFETYSFEINVPAGANRIDEVQFTVSRNCPGDGPTNLYFDNLHIRDPGAQDVMPPSPPEITVVNVLYTVVWTHPDVAGEDVRGYNLYRWIDGQPETRVRVNSDFVLPSAPHRPWQDMTVDYDVDYRYEMTAVDQAGNESPPSASFLRTGQPEPDDDIDPPLPVKVSSIDHTGPITLSWFASASYETVGYYIYRKPIASGSYTRITAEPATNLSFVDETVEEGSYYHWLIRAVDAAGNESAESPVLTNLPVDATYEWNFEGNDLNSLHLEGATTIDSPGLFGRGFTSDGTNGNNATPVDAIGLNFAPPEGANFELTLEMWCRFDDLTGVQYLVDKLNVPSKQGYNFYYNGASGNLLCRVGDGSVIRTIGYPWPHAPNTWHHLAFTVDIPNQEMKLYVDGVEAGSRVVTGFSNSPEPLRIGSYIAGTHSSLDGTIDKLVIADEIREYDPIPDANPPIWNRDPIRLPPAYLNSSYQQVINTSDFINDLEGDSLTFTSLDNPSWLALSSDGKISSPAGPPNEPEQFGLQRFSVSADDGNGGVSAANFEVFVGLSPYDNWAVANGLLGADADRGADPDLDGLDNETEFAFGLDPNEPSPGVPVHITSVVNPDDGKAYPQITFTYSNAVAFSFKIYMSTTLEESSWMDVTAMMIEEAPIDNLDGTSTISYRYNEEFSLRSRMFFKVEANLQ